MGVESCSLSLSDLLFSRPSSPLALGETDTLTQRKSVRERKREEEEAEPFLPLFPWASADGWLRGECRAGKAHCSPRPTDPEPPSHRGSRITEAPADGGGRGATLALRSFGIGGWRERGTLSPRQQRGKTGARRRGRGRGRGRCSRDGCGRSLYMYNGSAPIFAEIHLRRAILFSGQGSKGAGGEGDIT